MDFLNDFQDNHLNLNFDNAKLEGTQQLQVLQDKVLSPAINNYAQIGIPHCSPVLADDDESVPTPTSTIKDCDLALTTPEAPIYSPITPIDKFTFMSGNYSKARFISSKDCDGALATLDAPLYTPITSKDNNTWMSRSYENASPDSIQDYEVSSATSDVSMYLPIMSVDKNIIIGDSSEHSSPVRSISLSPGNINVFESLSQSNAFEFGELSDDSVKDPDFVAEEDFDDSSSDDSTCVTSSVLTKADVHIEKATSSSKHPTRQKGQSRSNKNSASSHIPLSDDCNEVFTEIETKSPVTFDNSRPELDVLVPNLDFVAENYFNDSTSDDSTRVTSSVLVVADVHIEKPTSSSKQLIKQKGQLRSHKNNDSSHQVHANVPINYDCIEGFTEIETKSPASLDNSRPELHMFVSNARKRRASENDLSLIEQPVKKVRRSVSLSCLILPLEQNGPISPNKRTRSDPSKWKRYIERGKRTRGEAYKTIRGKDVAARPIKEPRCVMKPKHKCNENVPEPVRKSIYKSFRSLKTLDEQRQFIVQHVKRNKKKRSTKEGPSRKECTNLYLFTVGGNIQVQVCREFFFDTLNITEGMVRGALNKITSEGVVEQDNRGRKSPPNKLSADRLNDIKSHIFSFPTMESHYCRSSTEYKYLEASLNIQTMHTLYKKHCTEKAIAPACLETYRKIFRSYKLKFHVPKKDLCKKCVAFKNGDTSSDDHFKHLKRRDDSYLRRDADKKAANDDATTLAFNFDLEAVLHTPKGAAGPFFYVRKLAVYNLTFYKFGDQDVECYTWDETEGNRGSIEIATCVYKYILDKDGVTHVRMMSDNCGGQQKNYSFCCMLLHLVSTHETIEFVDHVFYESGHNSHMECDSVHSKIEQKAKNVPIYTPNGWNQVMRSARMNPRPFKVNIMAHDEFLNFNTNEVRFAEEAPKRLRKKKKNKNNETEDNGSQDDTEKKVKINFNDAVWIQYRKESPKSIFIKTDYNDTTFTELKLKAKRGKSAAILPLLAYTTRIPISKAKKRDLMKLCHDNQIPRYYHSYYESLPDSEEVIDRLPEPDVDELE